MNLSAVIEAIQLKKIGLRPTGFFNVEGGDAALGSDFFDWCDSCLDQLGPIMAFCQECGRSPQNFLRIPAGDGDGVYVVFELFDAAVPSHVTGALVIFDNNYEIANAVRGPILEERVPPVPLALIKKRGHAALIDLASMAPTTKVLFSDGSAGANSKFAMVDVEFETEQRLNVYGIVEQVSSNIRDEVNRLSREAGMDRESVLGMLESLAESAQAIQDMPRGYGTLPEVLFRGLLVTQETLAQSLELTTEKVFLDWEELTGQYFGKICTSHQETMESATIGFNFLLHRELDRETGDLPISEAKRLLFNMWTWLYQGLHNLDDDFKHLIGDAYLPSREEVVTLLHRRGLKDAAQLFLDTGKIGEVQVQVLDTPHDFEAGSPKAAEQETTSPVLAKFCGECGTRFENEEAKFCSECGSRR